MRYPPYIKPPVLRAPAAHLRESELLPIILDSPHSGLLFPPYARAKRLEILRRDKRFFFRYADLFMDELIGGAVECGAMVIGAPYARSFIDLNRECDDILPEQRLPESAKADKADERLSLFWRRVGGIDLWHSLSVPEINRRLRWIWWGYHNLLHERLLSLRARHDVAVLLDCHSMPSSLSSLGGAHIVLGDNYGEACGGGLLAFAVDFFEAQGLRVSVNRPFSGGSIIRRHGLLSEGLMALQIEVRRDLYMDELHFRRGSNFAVMGGLFVRLVEALGAHINSGGNLH